MKKMTMLIAVTTILCSSAGAWGADSESQVFDGIDKNKNGSLTLDEFLDTPLGLIKAKDGHKLLQLMPPVGTKHKADNYTPLTAVEKRELFHSLDQDKDNVIVRKEWVFFKDGKFIFK